MTLKTLTPKTKIVATIGPASSSKETIKQMVMAGMSVARLNFSHGTYADHARMVTLLRQVSEELDMPITLLQDLQGPKIRVGQLPNGEISLVEGEQLTLVPASIAEPPEQTITIDYPYLAEDVAPGTQILLDDGLLELTVDRVEGNAVICTVLEGGILKSRKGVNLPSVELRLPSMTEKDRQDLDFGLAQGVDWVSLSFVRRAEDVIALKQYLADKGAADTPVIAKIEKPQAIANLEAIVQECNGLMVARGDLGVEMKPETVPLLQKKIIRLCNQKRIPVITATQMLDSMIRNSRPTRAEASDVANAIIDGTDAVMLSGESAVGDFPVKSVEMLAKIATEVERDIEYINHPPNQTNETYALSEALRAIIKTLPLRCIVAFTNSGYTSMIASAERPNIPVVAFTPHQTIYHRLNLIWGVKPVVLDHEVETFEELVEQAELVLRQRNVVQSEDKIVIMGGIPTRHSRGTNFIKIHTIH
ncbi:pyruvate kinase [Candidatus Synechococcus calcipolaris G9]|uniref:Pyruvate kinase n=1 Tax=Candidatus Synechococcus calcipolaris G9 TaxID=1497997 RepID=A0ABT6EXA1_9SYNE|nr:pyruvate kinase [Candidatus Synechococcus calcipolaris]MDG2990421.1 pyruvate kinase [Candidatus Synechococcus calcipolaris G9]